MHYIPLPQPDKGQETKIWDFRHYRPLYSKEMPPQEYSSGLDVLGIQMYNNVEHVSRKYTFSVNC